MSQTVTVFTFLIQFRNNLNLKKYKEKNCPSHMMNLIVLIVLKKTAWF
jgi:hypothetical protein